MYRRLNSSHGLQRFDKKLSDPETVSVFHPAYFETRFYVEKPQRELHQSNGFTWDAGAND
jgi:cellulose synthase/poly-beta-1,6-N-acetylglucosamine synthase-like glycosyltransferase